MASGAAQKLSRGSILIVALWSLCLLSMFTVVLGVGIRQRMGLVQRLDASERLRFAAEAGVKMAMAELRREDETPDFDALNEPWSNLPSAFKEVVIGECLVSVGYDYREDGAVKTRFGLLDEESKINLNTADVRTITRLLILAAGLDEEDAKRLAYRIVDWRDPDSAYQHPNYGAEDSDYRFLKNPYEAKDAPFETLDEILLVMGMTDDLYERIGEYATVYGKGTVNINTTSRVVLLSMGIKEGLVDRIMRYRNGEDLQEGTPDDQLFLEPQGIVAEISQGLHLSPSELAELSNAFTQGNFSTTSNTFMIRSVARSTIQRDRFQVVTVVDRSGEVLYWRESDLL